MARKPEIIRTEEMKTEAAEVANQLKKAGFRVFSSGYGAITMFITADAKGPTVVPTADARKLLVAA